jgi:hypothetical protein
VEPGMEEIVLNFSMCTGRSHFSAWVRTAGWGEVERGRLVQKLLPAQPHEHQEL